MPPKAQSSKQGLEPRVAFGTPVPDGYIYVPKGNIYITRNCRKLTQDLKQTVFVVKSNTAKISGIQVPKDVYDQVVASHNATAESRAINLQKRDDHHEAVMRQAVKKSFPFIPARDVDVLLSRTLKKRSGRVGRSTTLTPDEAVICAVKAHIRHCHTMYDEVIRESGNKLAARKKVEHQVERTFHIWSGGADLPTVKKFYKHTKKPIRATLVTSKSSQLLPKRQIRRRKEQARKKLKQGEKTYHQGKNSSKLVQHSKKQDEDRNKQVKHNNKQDHDGKKPVKESNKEVKGINKHVKIRRVQVKKHEARPRDNSKQPKSPTCEIKMMMQPRKSEDGQ